MKNKISGKKLEPLWFLIVFFLLFGSLGYVMGTPNMLNTLMNTAYSLLIETVFYIMGITVLSGALGKILVEFGVVGILEKILRPLMKPLWNLPGVAALGGVLTFLSDNVNVFAKGGYDVNNAQQEGASFVYDRYVLPGVELGFYGAGIEYFPIKSARKAIRFHAFWCSNTSDVNPNTFNVGVRWQMNILDRK